MPTGRWLNPVKPTRSMYAQGTICPQKVSRAGMSTSGCLVWMTSVSASGASVRSIVWNTGRSRAAFTDASNVRSRLYLASTAVNRVPSCHRTSGRSVNCQVVGPVRCQAVARAGWSVPSGWRRTRVSKTLKATLKSLA